MPPISLHAARRLGLLPPGRALPKRRKRRLMPISSLAEPPGEIILDIDRLLVVPKERPRLSQNGHVFTPDRTTAFARSVTAQATIAMRGYGPFRGPVAVDVHVILPVPKSWSRVERAAALAGLRLPVRRPDLDNAVKNVLDALVGVMFVDDSQVTDTASRKRYGERARVVFRFRRAELPGLKDAAAEAWTGHAAALAPPPSPSLLPA